MKQNSKYYIAVWAVLVVIFNVIVFVVPHEIASVSRMDSSFWIGYLFIMLTFIGQLGVALYALKDATVKIFYHISLLTISYGTLITMLVVGTLCMSIIQFPVWLGVILCLLVLGFGVITLVMAQAAASTVEGVDQKIKVKTFFIKSLTVDMDSLIAHCATQELKDAVKEVYEAVRYSDPMSDDALAGVESQIMLKVSELAEGVESANLDTVCKIAKEILILLNDRNKKCKLLK